MDKDEKYPWMKLRDVSLSARQEALNGRREELLHLAEEDGMTEDIQNEWCLLLVERDRVLKLKLQKDNEKMLQHHMVSLLQLLVTIGQFDHSSTPKPLKSALYNIYTQLSTHVNQSSTDITDQLPHRRKDKSESEILHDVPTPPPPPPVPDNGPCLNCGPGKRLRLDESDMEENQLGSMRRKNKPQSPLVSPGYRPQSRSKLRRSASRRTPGLKVTPGGKYAHKHLRTPKREAGEDSEDLRRCLLTGRENLKSTPGLKRSPGGTPQRSKVPVFSDNPNDLVTLALRKKFYNVRRLYGSPIQDGEDKTDSRESSFNLSID